jgi:hypothetical protein
LSSQVALPKKPPSTRALRALLTVASSFAVKAMVLAWMSHLASDTPSTLPKMPPTILTHCLQQMCGPFTSTFSATTGPAASSVTAKPASMIRQIRNIT